MQTTDPSQAARALHQDSPEHEIERTILAVLLSEPHPWTRTEIVRELGGIEIEVNDGLESLICCGLVNREGESLSASRTARAFERLEA
jgi:predicted transcriptional regulator